MKHQSQNQPILQQSRYKTIAVVGFLRVQNPKGLIQEIPQAPIHLTAGWQNENKQRSGEGINHIYKHFSDIPVFYQVFKLDKSIDYVQSITNFVIAYFSDLKGKNTVKVFIEDSPLKPILLKSGMGKMVIRFDDKKQVFIVLTCYKDNKIHGKLTGNLV